MKFYLGTHRPTWLERLDIPLFVSRRVMPKWKLPRARSGWALDSGGFTELQKFGGWQVSPQQYASDVRRYRDEIGHLEWAAPQDWMCEPVVINGGWAGGVYFVGTHLSVAEHQARTVENYLILRDFAPDLPFVPVLQGWELDDYLRHIDAYTAVGVDLTTECTVGVGSVCRRQDTDDLADIVSRLAETGLRLHGFGVKTEGLRIARDYLTSADSLAWSKDGRHTPTYCGGTSHKSEANCMVHALRWRTAVLAAADGPQRSWQPRLEWA